MMFVTEYSKLNHFCSIAYGERSPGRDQIIIGVADEGLVISDLRTNNCVQVHWELLGVRYVDMELYPNKPNKSKIKCPGCGKKLHLDPHGYYTCYTEKCDLLHFPGPGASGTSTLWNALNHVYKDHEKINKIRSIFENIEDYYGGVHINYHEIVDTIRKIIEE